jgi:hypothetical protein
MRGSSINGQFLENWKTSQNKEIFLNKFIICLCCFLILSHASSASCDSYELVKLLESKDFWSFYIWDKFDDSTIFKTTTWQLVRAPKPYGTKDDGLYSTMIDIDKLPMKKLETTVDAVTGNAKAFEMTLLNRPTADDYQVVVDWCTEKFGALSREDHIPQRRIINIASWEIGETLLTVKLENDPFGKYVVTLLFRHTIPPAPATQEQFRAHSVPALKTPRASAGATIAATAISPQASRYKSPPYIWENEKGVITVVNDISDVPEDKRIQFEVTKDNH